MKTLLVLLVACILIIAMASCSPTPPTPDTYQTSVDPELYAVLVPGSPPTFARKSISNLDQAYEVLPSTSVILTLATRWPGSSESKIVLKFRSGATSDPLEFVNRSDTARKQTLDSVGFYEAIGNKLLIITPPLNERQGLGFDIVMTNISPNPPPGVISESKPLFITILPVENRTKPSDVFFDCGTDFAAIGGTYHYNCKPGNSVVIQNFTLEGWLVESYPNCLGNLCWEDFHYYFVPNPDFIDDFYGPAGVLPLIAGSTVPPLRLPGNPAQPQSGQLSFQDRFVTSGNSKGVTINSFVLPFNSHGNPAYPMITIKTELNAWHVNDQGGLFSRHWVGRGPAPMGWISLVVPTSDPRYTEWTNTRWPFNPSNPDIRTTDLKPGDYIRVNGSLFEDSEHGGGPEERAWEQIRPGHGGWMEIHPPDWIQRLPPPTLRKTPVLVAFKPHFSDSGILVSQKSVTFAPEVSQGNGEVLRYREEIDGRFTVMSGINRTITIAPPNVTVSLNATDVNASFKAVYIVWWEKE